MSEMMLVSQVQHFAGGGFPVPGDKSLCHRAVILAAIADGDSEISNFSGGADNQATVGIFRQLGVAIHEDGPDRLEVHGVGIRGLRAPTTALDCGNSGTSMRLLAGLLAGQEFDSILTGDDSLCRRPMRRVIDPLRQMGATIEAAGDDNYAPLILHGFRRLHGLEYQMPVSSAQIKSCLLLAGLYADAPTVVRDPGPSRDHTERMLRWLGVKTDFGPGYATIDPSDGFTGRTFDVPGDPSSAAFMLALAAAIPGANVTARNVCVNATRVGFFEILAEMGAEVRYSAHHERVGEPVADVTVSGAELRGIALGGERLVRAIDEFPIICTLAALARGRTVISDANELRVKETDRISAMAGELSNLGATVEEHASGLVIQGGAPLRGSRVQSHGDHRVAMALAIAGCFAEGVTEIEDTACVGTSYPGFRTALTELIG